MQTVIHASIPLFVTTRAPFAHGMADIASTADTGLAMWRLKRYQTVFADFGNLGGAMTGVRLARQLRSESSSVRVFLMSDSVDASQRSWARANGASDVLARDAQAIAACLAPPPPRRAPSARILSQEQIDGIARALQVHGRVGPAAAWMVEEAVDDLARQGIGSPSVAALLLLLAPQIRSDRARSAFLSRFTTAGLIDAALP